MTNGTRVSAGGLITLKLEDEFRTAPKVGRLAQAAAVGDVWTVDRLVEAGINVNAAGDHYRVTPLMWAVLANSTQGTRALLKAGANPNQRVKQLSHEEAQSIVGAEPPTIIGHREWEDSINNLFAFNGDSAITFSIKKGNFENLRFLLDAGGDPNIDGRVDPAMFACTEKNGQINPMLKAMIDRGGSPNLIDRHGNGSLLERMMFRRNFSTAIYLMERGADPTYTHRSQLPFTSTYQTPPPPPDDLNGYDQNTSAVIIQGATDVDGSKGSLLARQVRQMMAARGVHFPVYDSICPEYLPKNSTDTAYERLRKCQMSDAYIEKIIAWNRRAGRLDGPYPDPKVAEIEKEYLRYKADHGK